MIKYLMFLNILDAYFNRVEHKLLSILLLKMPGAAMKTDRARNPSPLYAFPQRLKCSYCIQLQSAAMSAYKVTIHKKKDSWVLSTFFDCHLLICLWILSFTLS